MSLLEKQLIFISGKGGVGKSLVAAALALVAQRQGRRVLLVSIDDTDSRFHALFGHKARGDRLERMLPNLLSTNLQPKDVAREFLDTHMPVRFFNDRITSSPVFHYWFDATPMLGELLMLGKLFLLTESKEGRGTTRSWDNIIVEAPATGHALGLLGASQEASQMLIGPMKGRAEQITARLQDPERTALSIVTIAEDMPVSETIELATRVPRELGLSLGPVILNALIPRIFETSDPMPSAPPLDEAARQQQLSESEALDAAERFLRARRARAEEQLDRLRREIQGPPVLTLPWLTAPHFGPQELAALADALALQLSSGEGSL